MRILTLLGLAASLAVAAEPGLVGQWSFVASDGQTVRDGSGRGNDGRIEFGMLAAEPGGQVLSLDEIDAGVSIALRQPLGLRQAITALCWVRPAALRQQTVVFGVPHPTPSWTTPGLGISLVDRRAVFGMFLDQGRGKVLVTAPDELPIGAWTCLGATYDGATARLYVNGQAVAEEPARGDVALGDQPLLMGRGLGGKPGLRGRIGELRLYDRVLSAQELGDYAKATRAAYGPDEARPTTRWRDGTVTVETHGNTPGPSPWRARPTRLLELLDGYRVGARKVPTDAYGGRTDRPRQPTKGFFGVTKIDGRSWLVDPEGHLFLHVAVNAVQPPKAVVARLGDDAKAAQAITDQLRAAGFNGLGNWSSTRLNAVANPLVWVRRHDFMFAFAREKKLVEAAAGTQGFVNKTMPVFHPEFEAFCDRYGAALADTANDPRLLGIMTDNEIQCPTDMLDRFLASDPAKTDLAANVVAAKAWLARRPGGADAPITQRDRYEFIAYAFERYYQVVTKAIRRYDPNHLYLGSRLNYRSGEFDNPYLWRMLGRYHDVVSVNYYSQWGPDPDELAAWARWCDKPVIFTEWYAKALDAKDLANTHGAGWLVRTQEDRAAFYQHFVLGALEQPNVVGWHWFKYTDDPSTATALDNAGGANKGMCNADGVPYAPLLARMSAINAETYALADFLAARR
ncbi:MAG: hypothetical protein HZB16_09755 [Armatimonadetes bacterium]|nr:hypothetical protein [Armatimonadota bacterium]